MDLVPARGDARPDVTVVVPTIGRLALLERCLRGLAAQRGVAFDVVVVHGGEPGVAHTLSRWRAALDLRDMVVGVRTAAARRNTGWRSTSADLVAFTDDDCEPAPGWLAAALTAIGDSDLVQGPVAPHPGDAEVGGTFARTIRVDAPCHDFPNANLVYRRSALERVGGYDERFWGSGEDADLAWRVIETGGRVVWAPDALVWHAVRAVSFRQHLRSLPRWATLAMLLRRHPALRERWHHGVFWKTTHPGALLALLGFAGALVDRRLLLLAAPHLAKRVREAGTYAGLELAAADMAEVLVMVAGALRYRTVAL